MLNARAVVIVAAVACIALTACSTEDEQSACDLLGRDVVTAQVARVGGATARLARERTESLDQSVCR